MKAEDQKTPESPIPQTDEDLEGAGDRVCRDSARLGRWYVSEVNGTNSAEIPEFVPTRHELLQLAKYWATRRVADEFLTFLYDCSGFAESGESRRLVFGGRRISRIAKLIGGEDVQKAVCEAEEEFGKTANRRYWAIFTNGTPEEQKALQDEVRRPK